MGWGKHKIDIEVLEAQYKAGMTYPEMAKGFNCSCGAISFQVQKLKKLGRIEYRMDNIKKKEVKTRIVPKTNTHNSVLWKSAKIIPLPDWEYVSETGKTILDLKPRDCRWPCKDNLYCGKISVLGKSYCAEHQKKSEGRNDRSNPVV